MHATGGTMVNWKMMDTLVNHVDEVDMLLESNGGGKYIVGKCQALIHTLTWTNCVRKELKLPRCLVPDDMPEYGAITIVCGKYCKVKGSYSISSEDGTVCVVGWKE
ncbi:hypothetical protein BRADI_2g23664v3 [Brachypodium distachyon]|uniref:Uncharacterized protein n=2 Tax=Brachypodium distachyon TaxID=15368 RepID=A0A2K2DA48_BRADI|nr:hypothetical protein BRADI_2g23664v3 [Brachypodium distachyon]